MRQGTTHPRMLVPAFGDVVAAKTKGVPFAVTAMVGLTMDEGEAKTTFLEKVMHTMAAAERAGAAMQPACKDRISAALNKQ